jgi:hypothetical protein
MQEPSSEHEATQPVAGPGSAVNDDDDDDDGDDDDGDDDDGDDDDGDMVAGPTVEAHVNLAKTSSK